MKQILMKSVQGAFEYVMDHYAPPGLEEEAARKDTYAVISIQDTHTNGFGFVFSRNKYCRDVLTLYFDDVEAAADGMILFTPRQAEQIIDFILQNQEVDTLLIHCYAGISRTGAVADFAMELMGSRKRVGHSFNTHVRSTLETVWKKSKEGSGL